MAPSHCLFLMIGPNRVERWIMVGDSYLFEHMVAVTIIMITSCDSMFFMSDPLGKGFWYSDLIHSNQLSPDSLLLSSLLSLVNHMLTQFSNQC